MTRMNFRHMLFIGKDDQLKNGFGARVYIVGVRARTLYYAHGACDLKNKRAYPKWLQHGKKVFQTEELAHARALDIVVEHESRGYTKLKARQKPFAIFNGRAFEYERLGGEMAVSTAKY